MRPDGIEQRITDEGLTQSLPFAVADDTTLRQQSLLAAPSNGSGPGLDVAPEQPPVIAGYEIIGPLGAGGMGVVWRAVQLGTRRQVALKLLNTGGIQSQRAMRRFEREVELAARLEHPHIARVYDSGIHESVYYYAMELVDGLPLDQHVRRNGLGQRQVLELLRDVCGAVQHAHQHGVIHRDLKPSNIIVTSQGTAKVLDFGLAKLALSEDPGVSLDGDIAGTPAFMSPEQAIGSSQIDTRTDVYSLGVILYLLLTGKFPHEPTGSSLELLRRISTQPILRPRTVCAAVDRELEAVLLKALSSDPEGRYRSAGELGSDLENYLSGEPLVARRPTVTYVLGKRVRQHWAGFASAAAGLVLVSTAMAYSYFSVVHARNNERMLRLRSNQNEMLARQNEAAAIEAQKRAEKARLAAQSRLAEGFIAQGDTMSLAGRWSDAKHLYTDARQIQTALGEHTDVVDIGLSAVYRNAPPPLMRFEGHHGNVTAAAISPDGRIAASIDEAATLRLWDTRTGRMLRQIQAGRTPQWGILLFSPDSSRIVAACHDSEPAGVWDCATGRLLRQFDFGPAHSLCFSADGRMIATGNWSEGSTRIFDAAAGKVVCTIKGSAGPLAFSPDGSRFFLAEGQFISEWEVHTGEKVRHSPPLGAQVWKLTVSPDGRQVLAGTMTVGAGSSSTLVLWEPGSNRLRSDLGPYNGVLTSVAFRGDDRHAITAAEDGTVRIWDLSNGGQRLAVQGHDAGLSHLSLSSDGRYAVGAEGSGVMSLYAVDPTLPPAGWEQPGTAACVAVDDTGSMAASGTAEGPIHIWKLASGRMVKVLEGHAGGTLAVAFSPDARFLVSGGADRICRLWELATGKQVWSTLLRAGVHSVAFSDDGRRFIAGAGNDIGVWESDTRRQLRTFRSHETLSEGLRMSKDGNRIWAAAMHGCVMTFDMRMQLPAFLPQWSLPAAGWERHAYEFRTGCVYGPDAKPTIAGIEDVLVLLDPLSGHVLRQTPAQPHALTALALSNDGKLAASGSHGGVITLWRLDGATPREVATLRGHTAKVGSLAFARDRKLLVSVALDHTLRVWDLELAGRYRDFESRLISARKRLSEEPTDAAALATLNRWYAFRGASLGTSAR